MECSAVFKVTYYEENTIRNYINYDIFITTWAVRWFRTTYDDRNAIYHFSIRTFFSFICFDMDKWEVIIILRDSEGRTINKSDVIKYGQSRGVVKDDEFEGLWCVLNTGLKIRLSDYCSRVTVVKKGTN